MGAGIFRNFRPFEAFLSENGENVSPAGKNAAAPR
jgi:hypothetical protein